MVPAERMATRYDFPNIETSVESHEYHLFDTGTIESQSFSLRLGHQATSAFVPISPERNGSYHVPLRKKSKTSNIGGEFLSYASDSTISISSDQQQREYDVDTHYGSEDFQESPCRGQNDYGFFLLAPGLDSCSDERQNRKRISKRTDDINPAFELPHCSKQQQQQQQVREQEHTCSFYMPSTIKRKPKISLQPRLKKNVVFF